MNSALMRFVADYLADHAERADAGAGVLGRVQIDPQFGTCLELRFEANRCHVALADSNAVDCHVKIPWSRLVQLLDEELHPREALALDMVKIDGDPQLGERALGWLHDSEFGWHVYNRVPVWQLQANLGEKTSNEIRAFARDVYDLSLPAGIEKQAAIGKLVEHLRSDTQHHPYISRSRRSTVGRAVLRCIRARWTLRFLRSGRGRTALLVFQLADALGT